MTSAASLGQLAVHRKLIDTGELRALSEELRRAVTEGRPSSMARLLIAHGISSDEVRATLACGLGLQSVCCDACATPQENQTLTQRVEVPCPRCGSLLMGFSAFAPSDRVPVARESGVTARYPHVLPLPSGQDPNDETNAFGIVLPTPPPRDPRPPTGRLGEAVAQGEAAARFQDLVSRGVSGDRLDAWLAAAPQGLGTFTSGEGDLGGVTLSPGELANLRREDLEGQGPPAEAQQPSGRSGRTKKLARRGQAGQDGNGAASPAAAPGAERTLEMGDADVARVLAQGPPEDEETDGGATAFLDPNQVQAVLDMPAPREVTKRLDPGELAQALGEPKPRRLLPLVLVLLVLLGLIAGGVALLFDAFGP
ncbi:MAG: hypothetical protein AB7N76_11530 [Planctomycetota bacterium]